MKINNTTNLRIDIIHTQIMYNYAKIFALLIIQLLQKLLLRLKRSGLMFHMKHYCHIKHRFALFATYILAKKSQKTYNQIK